MKCKEKDNMEILSGGYFVLWLFLLLLVWDWYVMAGSSGAIFDHEDKSKWEVMVSSVSPWLKKVSQGESSSWLKCDVWGRKTQRWCSGSWLGGQHEWWWSSLRNGAQKWEWNYLRGKINLFLDNLSLKYLIDICWSSLRSQTWEIDLNTNLVDRKIKSWFCSLVERKAGGETLHLVHSQCRLCFLFPEHWPCVRYCGDWAPGLTVAWALGTEQWSPHSRREYFLQIFS